MGSRNYPAYISVTAGGEALVFLSEIDCSESIPAAVTASGTGKIPHESTLRIMSSFKKGSKVELRLESDCLWIGQLRLPMSVIR